MSEDRQSETVDWYEPRERGIIPLDKFHVSKNVHALLRSGKFEIRFNTAFEAVMHGCAERDSTWISPIILRSYSLLHALGYAHSTEVWQGSTLVGGQYGVALGSAFFGESMFRSVPEADKLALLATHQRLSQQGFTLWDCQFYTPHLGRMGAIEIPQADYLILLEAALRSRRMF